MSQKTSLACAGAFAAAATLAGIGPALSNRGMKVLADRGTTGSLGKSAAPVSAVDFATWSTPRLRRGERSKLK